MLDRVPLPDPDMPEMVAVHQHNQVYDTSQKKKAGQYHVPGMECPNQK
jgi:hypothetical protein